MSLLIFGRHIGVACLYAIMASPWKALQNCVKRFGEKKTTTTTKNGARLWKVVYFLVFCNISFSWLASFIERFQFFLLISWYISTLYRRIDGILLSSSKYGKRQMVMKNKQGDWSQSETVEHFGWIAMQNSLRKRANQIAQNTKIAEWCIINN